MKKLLAIMVVFCMVFSMMPLTAHAEELESFSVGEFKQGVEVPQGKIGKGYTFTPEESGTYAFMGYVGTLTAMSLYVSDGTQTISSFELDVENDFGNGACIFEAEAGQTYTLSVMVGFIYGGDTYPMNLRLEKAVAPTGILLSNSSLTGSAGEEQDLSMRFDPLWSIPEDLTWSSSNPAVATVDENGHVTLLASGIAEVSVTSVSGLRACCEVEVQAPTAFKFDCKSRTGYVGLDDILTYDFEPYGTSETVFMVSSDPEVASVEYDEHWDNWDVFYHKLGTTVITATTASGLTDTCTVTVKEMETVTLDQTFTVTVEPEDTVLFQILLEEEDYYTFYAEEGIGNLNISYFDKNWYGDNKDTQKIGGGMETLAVWNDTETTQTYKLWVRKAVPVERVEIDGVDTIYIGDTLILQAETFPAWARDENWTWTSSDDSVATVYGSGWYGYVTGVSAGTADITVTMSGGASETLTVTVKDIGSEIFNIGESKELTLSSKEYAYFSFTPEESGYYAFYMPQGESHYDPETESGYKDHFSLGIRNMAWEQYIADYTGASAYLEANQTYILSASNNWVADVEITATVYLDKLEEPQSISLQPDEWFENPAAQGKNLTLTCIPDTELPFLAGTATWTIADESVVALLYDLGSQARFRTLAEGTTTVTATLENGLSTSYTVEVYADASCGENVTWELTEDGTLIISGTGDMYDYYVTGDNPFSYLDIIENVIIEDGVTSIGDYAFSGCYSLENISIPNSVTRIGEFAFGDCFMLAKITIPGNISSIGWGAFNYLDCLQEVKFCGDAPKTIDEHAFNGTEATIYYPTDNATWTEDVMQQYGGTLTWVPYGETEDDDSTTSGTCGENLTWTLDSDGVLTISGTGPMYDYDYGTAPWYSLNIQNVIIEDGVTSIGDDAFSNCQSLTSITIPDSVVTIGYYAFGICDGLTSITIPNSVTSIGSNAFFGCKNLTSITIPNSVTSIGVDAFCGCSALTSVTIPASVSSIGAGAFGGLTSLSDFYVDPGNQYYSSDDQDALYNKDQTILCMIPMYRTEYTTPDTVETIETYAFDSAFESVTLGKNVSQINADAFYYCVIDNLYFTGDAPETIAEDAFYKTEATIYYPADNATWTEDVMQQYSGTLTWVGYTTECDHTYESVVTAPTCTEQGYTTHTCSKCGDSYVDSYVDALGHQPGETVVENKVDATCETAGSYDNVVYCSVCDAELSRETVTVPATGHSFGDWQTTKEPTCTENGEKQRTCSACDQVETEEIPAAGHSYESVVTDPTCTEQGYTTHTCANCGDSYVDTYTDPVDHVYEDGECIWCGDEEPEKPDFLLGDVDGNGVINTFDALLVLKYYTGEITAAALDLDAADVDGNGIVNTFDALQILKYYTGEITRFPAEK